MVTPYVHKWKTIRKYGWPNLIVGNGFSIGVAPSFDYSSLYEAAVSGDFLSKDAQSLFKDDDGEAVTNFEWVLRRLSQALSVDKALEADPAHITRLDGLYQEVRHALIQSVGAQHPTRNDVQPRLWSIGAALREFDSVFTTNYDIVPYWAVNEIRARLRSGLDFVDGFWLHGQPMPFDENVAENQLDETYPTATRLLYIHGGAHLVTTVNGRSGKLTQQQGQSITTLWKEPDPSWIPLIVTEGTSRAKSLTIERVDYLRWARRRLRQAVGNVVIFGHRLDADADGHIAELLENSPAAANRRIAISIYKPDQLSSEELTQRWADLMKLLPRHAPRLLAFDASSHLLGALPDVRTRRVIETSLQMAAFEKRMLSFSHDSGDPVWVSAGPGSPKETAWRWPAADPIPKTLLGPSGATRRQLLLRKKWRTMKSFG